MERDLPDPPQGAPVRSDPAPATHAATEVTAVRGGADALAGTLAALFAAASVWNSLGAAAALWCLAIVATCGARGAYALRARSGAAPPWYAALLVVSALLWGALAAWAAWSAPIGVALAVAAVLVVVALYSIMLYRGPLRLALPFTGGAFAPAIAGFAATGGSAGLASAAGLAAIGACTWLVARELQALAGRMRDIEGDRDRLMAHLDARRDQIEKLTASIKAHEKKQRELDGELRRANADLGLLQNKTRLLADTIQRLTPDDAATGLASGHRFVDALSDEWQRAMRTRTPVSLLRFRLDDFDEYARNYDAKLLERCLSAVGQAIRSRGRRAGDCAARLGAHDFALLLPGADAASAARIAEHVRLQILEQKFPNSASELGHVTTSVGIATLVPARETQCEELQRRADSALHEAAFKGGNCVSAYRGLEALGLERWSAEHDGNLSQERLLEKLRKRGFKPVKKTRPGAGYLTDHTQNEGYAFGVLKGRLRISREGQSAMLGPGDCWFIPPGAVISAETAAGVDTICIEAIAESNLARRNS